MKLIRSIRAWYPIFSIGCEPGAVPCELSIVEANGKRYLKTPFAMLDAFADDDCERQIGRGYYATAEDCNAYLQAEYPCWKRAMPIMDALCSALHHHGALVGIGRMADKLGCSVDAVHKIARGHRSIHQLSKYLKALSADKRHGDPQPNQMAY
jgi:hypothetical protein